MAKPAAEKKAEPTARKKSSAVAAKEDLPTLAPAPKAKTKVKAPKETVAAVAAPTEEAAPAKAKNGAKRAAKKKASVPSAEQRQHYVSVAAYFVAERHGFAPGRDAANWAEAEAEVDSMISAGLLAD